MGQGESVRHCVSAGGVVVRGAGASREVALCGRFEPRVWSLPKGTPEASETREQTALREVSEETGLDVRALRYIDSIDYSFEEPKGVRCFKTVHYYLMESVGGDTSKHDHEFDEARWFSVEDALDAMSYRNEANVVEKGLSLARGE